MGVIGTIVILKLVDMVIGVRVTRDEEVAGLDLSQHGEEGYNLDIDVLTSSSSAAGYAEPVLSAAPSPIRE
jgi:hypothetical protein